MGDEFSEDMEYDVPEETFEEEVPEMLSSMLTYKFPVLHF